MASVVNLEVDRGFTSSFSFSFPFSCLVVRTFHTHFPPHSVSSSLPVILLTFIRYSASFTSSLLPSVLSPSRLSTSRNLSVAFLFKFTSILYLLNTRAPLAEDRL